MPTNGIRRLAKAGKFSAPIRLGPATIGWIKDESDECIVNRPRVGQAPKPNSCVHVHPPRRPDRTMLFATPVVAGDYETTEAT